MHTDVTGKPLAIGQKIVFAEGTRSAHGLCEGKVVRFTPKRVEVEALDGRKYLKDPRDKIAVIPDEEGKCSL